ncbi:hypothetical protein FRB99_003120 [Tulasnella sp. 403]|nr:hypothetical protein FRB99_003120 [Tulasnella sp. 403]
MNSNRPPPPAGSPPSYAFVARMYRRSLRPIVMGATSLGALWSFLWGISALADLSSAGDLKVLNIVLGVLYLTVGLIEVFGFVAAMKSNLPLVRVFCFASILAAIMVLVAECIRFSVYFTHKQRLIDNCTADATGATVETFGGFWGHRHSSTTLSEDDARNWCTDSWTRNVWSSVAWLIIATVLGWFFVSLAFSYYHQLLSPQPLAPSQAFQMGAFGDRSGPYGPYNPQGGYQYPAPAGPPPNREDFVPPYDPAKVPDYEEGGYGKSHFGDDKIATESRDTLAAGYSTENGGRHANACMMVRVLASLQP